MFLSFSILSAANSLQLLDMNFACSISRYPLLPVDVKPSSVSFARSAPPVSSCSSATPIITVIGLLIAPYSAIRIGNGSNAHRHPDIGFIPSSW